MMVHITLCIREPPKCDIRLSNLESVKLGSILSQISKCKATLRHLGETVNGRTATLRKSKGQPTEAWHRTCCVKLHSKVCVLEEHSDSNAQDRLTGKHTEVGKSRH